MGGDITRSTTPVIGNSNVTTATGLLDLYNVYPPTSTWTRRMEFTHDSGNNRAKIKASTSGYGLYLEGDTVALNTVNSTGTIATFRTSDSERLSVSYASGTPKLKLSAGTPIILDNSSSSGEVMVEVSKEGTSRLVVRYTSTPRLQLEAAMPFRIDNTASGNGTMCTMAKSGVDWLSYEYNGTANTVTIASQPDSVHGDPELLI
jgi:hypothetical protein